MKIGIILTLIGAGLLGGAYLSYSQLPAGVSGGQGTQANAFGGGWETTLILGVAGLIFLSIGVGTIKYAIRRKAMQFVENKAQNIIGGKLNAMGVGNIVSQFMRPNMPKSGPPSPPPPSQTPPPQTPSPNTPPKGQ